MLFFVHEKMAVVDISYLSRFFCGIFQGETKLRNKIIYALVFILVVTLFFGTITKALPENLLEPENPILTEVSELITNVAEKSGANETMEDDLQFGSELDEEEKPEEEEPPKEEPEEQKPDNEETGDDIPEEDKEISEEQPPEKEENSEDVKQDGNGESGEQDEQNPNKGEEGKIPTEGGEDTSDNPGTGEVPGKDEHGLVTDLYDRVILFSELEDDMLHFYAYYSDTSIDADIRVNYKIGRAHV